MKAESRYNDLVRIAGERNTLVDELDDMFIGLRDTHKATEKLNID